jgi:hypothetical protein
MTVTLPFDLHSHAIKLAEAQEISVSELMLNFLRESFNNHQVYKPQDDCFETNAVEQFDDLLYKSQEKCLGNFEKAESASPENDFLDNATNGLHNSEYGLAV